MGITLDRTTFRILLTLAVLLVLVGIAVLGRGYTPDPARLIGWSNWTALKLERQYRQELVQLREDLAGLGELLRERPDPVRAEMAATRVAQRHASGLELLAQQREVVLLAAEVVRDWAANYIGYDEAVTTVNAAIELLAAGDPGELDFGADRGGGERPSAAGQEHAREESDGVDGEGLQWHERD